MAKFVSPQIEEQFLKEDDPILVLNTSCQIQSFNDFAAQLLYITEKENNYLQLDELSKSRWNSFVNKIKKQTVGYCNLKVKVNNMFKEVKLIGHFNEKENLITAKILVHALENDQYNINNDIFYSLFNEVSHGVIISDVNGIVIDVNDVALGYLNCNREDIVHLSHETFLHAFNDYKFQKFQYLATLKNSGSASIDLSKENAKGEQCYYKLETKYNFLTKKLVTTVTDISEITRLKQQVERQEQLSTVGEMAASIIHEVRNPMTSIKGFLDLMKMNSNDEYKRYIQIMSSEIERMDSILSELLNLSKPTEKKMDKVSIYKLVTEVTELMQQSAVKNNICIQLKVAQVDLFVTKVIGNETRLKQLFINLIKNAIEVMECGGIITVELEQTRQQNVQISVRDEGIGMTQEECDKLFTPFYTTKESGTGLGLALVKKVVDEHQGTINVDSTLGEGTTFTIEFPVNSIEQENKSIDIWINNRSIKLPVV